MRCDFAFGAIKLLNHGFLHDLHALLHKLLLREFADLFIFDRQNAVHDFNHGRVSTHRVIEAGEFNPNGAGPNDQKLLWHTGWLQCMFVRPNQITVRF